MNQTIAKAHDHFFRMAMTDKRVAHDFFAAHLPTTLLEAIDLNYLELQPSSHIDDFRSEAITDMTFRTKIHSQSAYLQLQVEHQSSPDALMPFRTEKYRINFIDQYLKQNPDATTIPLVIPLVLYHGKKPWGYSTDIRDLIAAPKTLVDAYAFKPFILIDLNTIHDAALKEHLWSGVMELALKHIFAQNVLPYVESMMSLLRQLEQADGRGFVENVLVYILDRGEMDQASFLSLVRKELPPELGDKIMTASEQLIAKGMQQGVQQGMQQGIQKGVQQGMQQGKHLAKLEMAHEMLAKGLAETLIAEITKLSLDEIHAEVDKLKTDLNTQH